MAILDEEALARAVPVLERALEEMFAQEGFSPRLGAMVMLSGLLAAIRRGTPPGDQVAAFEHWAGIGRNLVAERTARFGLSPQGSA